MKKKLDIYTIKIYSMEYLDEHTYLSTIGYLLGFLSFIAALVASVSYFFDANGAEGEKFTLWRVLGRLSFITHSVAVLSIVGLLFFMLREHFYEFNYVWKYSNNSMPNKYLFACFWGGQEGSFLLWTFWNVIIGGILVWKAKKWESSVMATLCLVQVFMSSMILGVYVGDLKIGSSPFVLMRMLPENIGLPWTEMSDYMSKVDLFKDGKGLNPLLRNYWMTIHPPTLFLGFALTVVPFCYAIAGLWKGKFIDWVKPALPWTFFGIGILGVGILMGGAWAYESLSFGGFWAWDPVENVSYIPWLTFVGAGHLMLVNKKKPISIFLTVILTALSFILVLYSTFLTRSGVLGDSSVHSFTDNGMLGQLLMYILFFVWLTIFVILPKGGYRLGLTLASLFLLGMGLTADYDKAIYDISPAGVLFIIGFIGTLVFLVIGFYKNFPAVKEEEKLWSREFWMFIGSMVLFLACLQIFIDNSFPVWNKLFLDDNAKPEPLMLHYNFWQGAFAVFVALFIGFTQFLKYKSTSVNFFLKRVSLSVIVSVVVSVLLLIFFYSFNQQYFIPNEYSFSELYNLAKQRNDGNIVMWFPSIISKYFSGLHLKDDIEPWIYIGLLFTSVFSIVANLDYLIRFIKGKLNAAGSSIAHIGFGMILFGALISNSQGEKLTNNKKGKFNLEELSDNFKNDQDAQLVIGDTSDIGEYYVVFKRRFQEDINVYYEMEYFNKIALGNEKYSVGEKVFNLTPFVQLNEQFGNAAEPATKHYASYDVFSFIKYPNPSAFNGQNNGYMPYDPFEVSIGDTVSTKVGYIVAKNTFVTPRDNEKVGLATIEILDFSKNKLQELPLYFKVLGDTALIPAPAEIPRGLDFKIGLTAFSPPIYEDGNIVSEGRIALDIAEKEYVVMQAKKFPLINVLWLGIIIMLIGSVMSVFYRIRKAA